MLLQKKRLSPAARQHFGLSADPFADPREPADVFLTRDMRYAREALWEKLRFGGFLALVGESGSGKSTLREELIERAEADPHPSIIIQPYVLAMEDSDSRGKTLKAGHISEAIVHAITPQASLRSSPEARGRQVHSTLAESARAGTRHLLIIEEAHCLPKPTLKHLKRYLELKSGMRGLLGIVLIAQPELLSILREGDPTIREVYQRLEILHLPPLDNELEGYIHHRLKRAGAQPEAVLAPGAVQALRARLTPERGGSLCYPLCTHNVLAVAMNNAAELGMPHVTAELIRECR